MVGELAIALVVAVIVLAAALVGSRRALLGWYVWETRRQEVPELPDEAILTYPLA
jgi:hypothetical protein